VITVDVKGNPTDVELAALVAALAVARRPAAPVVPLRQPRPGWVRPSGYRPPGSWVRASA
jgi:hypothetical protein